MRKASKVALTLINWLGQERLEDLHQTQVSSSEMWMSLISPNKHYLFIPDKCKWKISVDCTVPVWDAVYPLDFNQVLSVMQWTEQY